MWVLSGRVGGDAVSCRVVRLRPACKRLEASTGPGTVRRMDPTTVHDVHMAINLVHRFVYFAPEGAEESPRSA